MKKVLFITNIPSPYRVNFYNELSKSIDLTVIFEARRAKGINFDWNDDDINYNAIFLSDGNISEKKFNYEIIKKIRQIKFDYLFVTNYGYATELLAIFYLILKKIPYYIELDGALLDIRKKSIKNYVKNKVISNASKCFSPSNYVDLFYKYYGAKEKNITRYSFSSLKETDVLTQVMDVKQKKDLKDKLKIKESYIVLAVGQFIHRKGFDVLIKAAKNIRECVGIYFVGGTPTEEYYTLLENLNLENVHFVEFMNSQKLREYYLAADIFCLPTREDVWGLVINEAMAYGLPIITTNKCGAGVELIKNKENGYIIASEDVEQLSEKINILIDNPQLRVEQGKKNLSKIRNYTIEAMVKEHLNFLNERERLS